MLKAKCQRTGFTLAMGGVPKVPPSVTRTWSKMFASFFVLYSTVEKVYGIASVKVGPSVCGCPALVSHAPAPGIEPHLSRVFDKPKFVPQGAKEFGTSIALKASQLVGVDSFLLKRLETAILSYVTLSQATSVSQFCAILLLILKTEYSESVALELFNKFKVITGLGSGPQGPGSDDDNPPSDDLPDWIKLMRTAGENWELAVKNPSFRKLSKFLTMCVTLGVLGPQSIHLGKMQILSIEASKEQVTATSLVDAMFSTVTFVCESGYASFRDSSFMPFLFTDINATKLDRQYVEVMENFEYAINGNLYEFKKVRHSAFIRQMDNVIALTKRAAESLSQGVERRILNQRLLTLGCKRANYLQRHNRKSMRKAPFAFYVTGGSGLGKTDVASLLVKACGLFNDIDVSQDCTYTVNDNDDYMSGFHAGVTTMIFDDFVNTDPNFVGGMSPTGLLIKVINNNVEFAIMADLESKGTMLIEPSFVIVTSNIMDLQAGIYSCCPASVLRRGQIHVRARVKKQFQKDHDETLDAVKVNNFYRDPDTGEIDQPDFPDIWNLDLFEAKINNVPSGVDKEGKYRFQKETCSFIPCVNSEGKEMTNVSIEEACLFAMPKSREYFEHQEQLVQRTEKRTYVKCDKCNHPTQFCRCVVEEDKVEFDFSDMPPLSKPGEHDDDSSADDESMPSFTSERKREFREGGDDDEDEDYDIERLLKEQGTPATKRKMTRQDADERLPQDVCLADFQVMRVLRSRKKLWDTFCAKRQEGNKTLYMAIIEKFSYFLTWKLQTSLTFIDRLESVVRSYTLDELDSILLSLENSPCVKLSTWIPSSYCKPGNLVWDFLLNSRCEYMVDELHQSWKDVTYSWPALVVAITMFCVLSQEYNIVAAFSLFASYYSICFYMYLLQLAGVRALAESRIAEERLSVKDMFARIRDDYGATILKTVAVAGALFGVYKLWTSLQVVETQAHESVPDESPPLVNEEVTPDDIKLRDTKTNVWLPPAVEKVLPAKFSSSMEQVSSRVAKNILRVQLNECGIQGLILQSGVIMVPKHAVTSALKRDPVINVSARRIPGEYCNATFSAVADSSVIVDIEGHDYCVMYVSGTGDVRSVWEYFPDKRPVASVPCKMLWRERDGELVTDDLMAEFDPAMDNSIDVDGELFTFYGCEYQLHNKKCVVGMCAAPILADMKVPYIAGMHVGGVNDTSYGCAATITRGEVQAAMEKLLSKVHTSNLPSASDNQEMYGKPNFVEKPLHPKSPLNFIETGNFAYYGECSGRSYMKSKVRTSSISATVEKICGVPQLWGPPKFKGPHNEGAWKPWHDTLKVALNPSVGLPPNLVEKAMEDYMGPLKEVLEKDYEFYKTEIRKLEREEIVSGIDGKNFIDAMKPNTSRGFPLGGPKLQDMVDTDPTPTVKLPKTFTDEHWAELDKFEAHALRGERYNAVFKAALKDEPTLLTKEKVRVFQAAPLVLQLAMRKYFLPLARFLSLHPKLSECAVGVNAYGKEMDDLFKHMGKNGWNRCYAGDYSKYDLRMPAQLVLCAFEILIEFARMFDEYTDDDLMVMEAIAAEVAFALVAYNGDLIKLFGTNPSGQNLTAYINSIVNSLIHRCAFYQYVEEAEPGCELLSFRDFIALITYGDDYNGTVSEDTDYDNLYFQAFCLKYGMTVTSADKTSEMQPYGDLHETDFLKRKPIWNEELGVWMGKLDEMSIYKSLHCNMMPSDGNLKNVSHQTIAGALGEWFLYGREVYDEKHAQMREIAEIHGITKFVPNLDLTYDDRLAEWRRTELGED